MTLRWEAARAALVRPAQLAGQGSGVLLLVAIQHYEASSAVKATVAAAVFAGMLLAPFVVMEVTRRRAGVSHALAALLAVAAVGFLIAGASPRLPGFLLGVALGPPLLEATSPLVTALWQGSVPRRLRGRLFGVVGTLSGVVGIVAGLAIAAYLGDDAGRYRPVVLALAAATAVAAACAWRIPTRPLRGPVRSPLEQMRLLLTDRVFGYLIVVWFLLGLGNLASVPLRVEYVASGNYGFHYTAGQVLLLTVVIPQAVSLFAALLWGRWFDRLDFLRERVAINAVFIGSIVLYFRPSLASQVAGAVLFGLAQGGGLIAWNLWVTKYAPPDRTADYMAVHTFLTGVRGLAAPFLAYAMLTSRSLGAVNSFSLWLLAISTMMLFPLMLHQRRARAS